MGEMLHNMASEMPFPKAACREKPVQSLAFVLAAIVSVLLCSVFAECFFSSAGYRSRMKLNEKVNPNYASAASLVRLPGIGIGRAEAIIAYRRQQKSLGEQPFRTLDDLRDVKGIGVKTAKNISQWVDFEQ